MKFILENYLLFVLIGLFLVFALIGYIIDTLRKNNNGNNENNIPPNVNDSEQLNKMNPPIESVNITNINNNSTDDLLNTYNNNQNNN